MAKSKFRPLHDRVVVKRIEAEEKTKGGIIIPDTAKEKPSQGEITAVGPGGRDEAGKLIPIDLKVGDRVLFGKWSGHRDQARRGGPPDHEGERHHGRARLRPTHTAAAHYSSCPGFPGMTVRERGNRPCPINQEHLKWLPRT